MSTVEFKAKLGKSNLTTILMQTVVDACIALAPLHPYVYAASPKTNSVYIKFKVGHIGSLRISNHKSKYWYKWNICINEDFKDGIKYHDGRAHFFANYQNRQAFFVFMLEHYEC